MTLQWHGVALLGLAAIAYVARATWRTWMGAKASCGGSCSCAGSASKTNQPGARITIVPVEELRVRRRENGPGG